MSTVRVGIPTSTAQRVAQARRLAGRRRPYLSPQAPVPHVPALPGAAPAIPPVAAPAAAPAPSSPLTALDPSSEGSLVARQQALNGTLAGIVARQGATDREFYDPADPTSRQNSIIRQFRQLGGAHTINQASSGQLYSGSSNTENALDFRDQGFAHADLKRQYDAITAGLNGEARSARDQFALDREELIRSGSVGQAGDPTTTPLGEGDSAAAAQVAAALRPHMTPAAIAARQAALKARVKARLLAARRAH